MNYFLKLEHYHVGFLTNPSHKKNLENLFKEYQIIRNFISLKKLQLDFLTELGDTAITDHILSMQSIASKFKQLSLNHLKLLKHLGKEVIDKIIHHRNIMILDNFSKLKTEQLEFCSKPENKQIALVIISDAGTIGNFNMLQPYHFDLLNNKQYQKHSKIIAQNPEMMLDFSYFGPEQVKNLQFLDKKEQISEFLQNKGILTKPQNTKQEFRIIKKGDAPALNKPSSPPQTQPRYQGAQIAFGTQAQPQFWSRPSSPVQYSRRPINQNLIKLEPMRSNHQLTGFGNPAPIQQPLIAESIQNMQKSKSNFRLKSISKSMKRQ